MVILCTSIEIACRGSIHVQGRTKVGAIDAAALGPFLK